jgi:hypothetical protein
MTTQSINLPKQTKYYSSLLYRLSDELLRHDYDPVSPDEVAEAAERLDTQTVTIRGLQLQVEMLAKLLREAVELSDRDVAKNHPGQLDPRTDEYQQMYERAVAALAMVEKS